MTEYIKLNLISCISIWSCIGFFLILCMVIAVHYILPSRFFSRRRIIVSALLCEYVYVVLCVTVFCRTSEAIERLKAVPFWSYRDICIGNTQLLFEDILNILLFLPIGFLITDYRKFRKWWKSTAFGLCLSSVIEVSQYLFDKGYCEFDDIFHNTLGCFLGYCIFRSILNYKNR